MPPMAPSEDGRELVFCSRETGVPAARARSTGGVGSQLIREVVPYILGGTSRLEATGDDVRCVLELPLQASTPGMGGSAGGEA